ncbi:MAG: gliding motility-associated C-terminal domain-containing protein [Bacteroidales bacterium]
MRKSILLLLFSFVIGSISAQKIIVEGGQKDVISYQKVSPASGLDGVYVLYGLDHAKLTFNSTTGNTLKWYSYTNNIAAKTLLKDTESLTSTLEGLTNNTGYVLEDGADIHRIWIIDYKQYEATALAVSSVNLSPCDELHLTPTASLYSMGYNEAVFPSNRKLLDIQLPIKFKTMEFSDASSAYVSKDNVVTINSLSADILLTEPPLMNTTFALGDDIFSAHWGLNKNVVTPEYTAVAVSAKGVAKHTPRDADNELEKTKGDLGGSAPVDVTFDAYANEPTTTFYSWEFATDDKFSNVFATFSAKEVRYTFSEAKIYYVRLTVSNTNNSCLDSTQTFTVEVTESSLNMPNAFSPNGDGKNDVFLVAYKSILKFNGWIFNRWGNELFTWTDPAKGWDGKIGGRYATPGVYFYVIEAEGSEGKKYNLKGAVNVFTGK